jgi:hypothetical protein
MNRAVREAVSGILILGALVGEPQIPKATSAAIEELRSLGYQVPTEVAPVKIVGLLPTQGTSRNFLEANQMGNWRPGLIRLRMLNSSIESTITALRHELVHEASHLTCKGRLPIWAEEAHAMKFSGELSDGKSPLAAATAADLAELKIAMRADNVLSKNATVALREILTKIPWSQNPCSVPKIFEDARESDLSYRLIHLYTGRVLASQGSQTTLAPLGSLLKIPYLASLPSNVAETTETEDALVRSDTGYFSKLSNQLDLPLFSSLLGELPILREGLTPRSLLGERDPQGTFPFEKSLEESALLLRDAFLSEANRFAILAKNGDMAGSTLQHIPADLKKFLSQMRVLAKTGTISSHQGVPILGSLLLIWPKENPLYLAIIRAKNRIGADVVAESRSVLISWNRSLKTVDGIVAVDMLSLLPRAAWQRKSSCEQRAGRLPIIGMISYSRCGKFQVATAAKTAKPLREVTGVWFDDPVTKKSILLTDPFSYAEGVVEAEAADLKGEARDALLAVAMWNGVKSDAARFAKTKKGLCDNTRCMVFQGNDRLNKLSPARLAKIVHDFDYLDNISKTQKHPWLFFEKGGDSPWTKSLATAEVSTKLGLGPLIHIQRQRGRDGAVSVTFTQTQEEQTWPCELVRNRLKLLSCPDKIVLEPSNNQWIFSGVGEGHGQGLSISRATDLAKQGYVSQEILKRAFVRPL